VCYVLLRRMKLISFDIGIKNMAYCLFDIHSNDDNKERISILKWEVLNLLLDIDAPSEPPIDAHCSEKVKKGKEISQCKGSVKYRKGDLFFCTKHAKTCSFLLPNKNYSETALKKKKVEDLQKIATEYGIIFPEKCLKKDMYDNLCSFFAKKTLDPIVAPKMKNAGETDLICIGRNMKRALDNIPNIEEITHVIIENQISPIANRMKTLQGMLTQYFIMRGRPSIIIEFISSSNKLKGFDLPKQHKLETETPENTIVPEGGGVNKAYKQHKKDGIHICSQFLEANDEWNAWKNIFQSKAFASKKDDLADSFLQGIWYLKNKKIIVYAENLKINSVLLT